MKKKVKGDHLVSDSCRYCSSFYHYVRVDDLFNFPKFQFPHL